MFSEEIIKLAGQIGSFYLNKTNNNYEETTKLIQALRINNIELVDGKLIIELSRPGLLIGKKGQNINDLTAYLGLDITIKETPCHIEDFIIPYPPMEIDWEEDDGHY